MYGSRWVNKKNKLQSYECITHVLNHSSNDCSNTTAITSVHHLFYICFFVSFSLVLLTFTFTSVSFIDFILNKLVTASDCTSVSLRY